MPCSSFQGKDNVILTKLWTCTVRGESGQSQSTLKKFQGKGPWKQKQEGGPPFRGLRTSWAFLFPGTWAGIHSLTASPHPPHPGPRPLSEGFLPHLQQLTVWLMYYSLWEKLLYMLAGSLRAGFAWVRLPKSSALPPPPDHLRTSWGPPVPGCLCSGSPQRRCCPQCWEVWRSPLCWFVCERWVSGVSAVAALQSFTGATICWFLGLLLYWKDWRWMWLLGVNKPIGKYPQRPEVTHPEDHTCHIEDVLKFLHVTMPSLAMAMYLVTWPVTCHPPTPSSPCAACLLCQAPSHWPLWVWISQQHTT